MMDKENSDLLRKLLDGARAVGPQILADDYLSQCVGMVGYACIRGDITLDEHADYWVEITAIRDARDLAKKALVEVSPQ